MRLRCAGAPDDRWRPLDLLVRKMPAIVAIGNRWLARGAQKTALTQRPHRSRERAFRTRGNLRAATLSCPSLRRTGKESSRVLRWRIRPRPKSASAGTTGVQKSRSEEHTSELQSLMRNSYAV